MTKHTFGNTIKRHKAIAVILAVVLLAVFLFAELTVKSEVLDSIYYPHQEKVFNIRRDADELDSVTVRVSSDSPDATVKVLSSDGTDCGSFHGAKRNWETRVGTNGNYKVIVRNDTRRWITAHVDYSDDTCSPTC
ncbi:hypothetical protein OZX74_03780 [Bifidobacterium sp. ESL0798]|uniref:hypothetical protein n=1 Tax=Bifidobacterium sp. ESL0798 TaxID=2983235 RepID=UPI0023F81F92|nr:hypothetical protein [Bifidobacterium sp. ESL0798]WEV74647.1 hypothetical protein OZX74_03780 [Bifidobacterium sp. ESL0798]